MSHPLLSKTFEEDAFETLRACGLKPLRPRFDVPLQGSPQRCAERMAVLCSSTGPGGGALWIVERLRPGQKTGRQRIAQTLHALHEQGFTQLPPYRVFALEGQASHVLTRNDRAWQVSPFLHGSPLPRPEYLEKGEAGESLGNTLAALQQTGACLPGDLLASLPELNFQAYCATLLSEIAANRPQLARIISPLAAHLAPLWESWTGLPVALAHGDCHPLNVIWTRSAPGLNVLALIDWEFCGMRPLLHDLANCLGCVGVEHPDGLTGNFAKGLLQTYAKTIAVDPLSLRMLPDMVLALRFGWLAEWLRAHDEEMIELEIDYMRLLVRDGQHVYDRWTEFAAR